MFKVLKKQVTKYYKYGNSPNAKIVGSLQIEGSNMTGFSSSSYAVIPIDFSPSDKPWEFVIRFAVAGSSSSVQTIAVVAVNGYQKASFGISTISSKFRLYLNSVSTNIAENVRGTHQIATNTVYYVKLAFTGSQYTLDYSTDDGKTYKRDITIDSTLIVGQGTNISLGYNLNFGEALTSGAIGLAGAYLNYDGKRAWTGTLAEETTSESYDFSRIEDVYSTYKKDDKYYAMEVK